MASGVPVHVQVRCLTCRWEFTPAFVRTALRRARRAADGHRNVHEGHAVQVDVIRDSQHVADAYEATAAARAGAGEQRGSRAD